MSDPRPRTGITSYRTAAICALALTLVVLRVDRARTTGPSAYIAIDLGALGGSPSLAAAINAAGNVTGRSRTATGQFRAFFWSPTSGMIDLGTLGGTFSAGLALNEHDQVAGWSKVPTGDDHAFFWTRNGGMIDLGSGIAVDVNASGQVVGSSSGYPGFSWTASGGRIDLPGSSYAFDLNDAGQVVGVRLVAPAAHAFVWSARDGMLDLGTLVDAPDASSVGTSINERGQVAGVNTGPGTLVTGFLWSPHHGFDDLGTPAVEINFGANQKTSPFVDAAGHVAGTTDATGVERSFFWTPAAGAIDIGTLGGENTIATAISGTGRIVGSSEDATAHDHAFSWTETEGMVDLGTLGGCCSTAFSVNDSGDIAGEAFLAGDVVAHAVVWLTPVRFLTRLAGTVGDAGFQQGARLLENALNNLNRHNAAAACNQTGAFVNQVQAQRGKSVPAAIADQWLASAGQIRAALGCR